MHLLRPPNHTKLVLHISNPSPTRTRSSPTTHCDDNTTPSTLGAQDLVIKQLPPACRGSVDQEEQLDLRGARERTMRDVSGPTTHGNTLLDERTNLDERNKLHRHDPIRSDDGEQAT